MHKQDFPEDGDGSFRQIEKDAHDAGCTVILRGRKTRKRDDRPTANLTIRGPSCKGVHTMFVDGALRLGLNLNMVLLPHEVQRGRSGRPELPQERNVRQRPTAEPPYPPSPAMLQPALPSPTSVSPSLPPSPAPDVVQPPLPLPPPPAVEPPALPPPPGLVIVDL